MPIEKVEKLTPHSFLPNTKAETINIDELNVATS